MVRTAALVLTPLMYPKSHGTGSTTTLTNAIHTVWLQKVVVLVLQSLFWDVSLRYDADLTGLGSKSVQKQLQRFLELTAQNHIPCESKEEAAVRRTWLEPHL